MQIQLQGDFFMLQNQIKTIFNSAVSKVVDNIDQYTFSPEKDLKRHKKLPADKLISFLISEGSASTKLELLDFFNLSNNCVTNSALISKGPNSNQRHFNKLCMNLMMPFSKKRFHRNTVLLLPMDPRPPILAKHPFHQMSTT